MEENRLYNMLVEKGIDFETLNISSYQKPEHPSHTLNAIINIGPNSRCMGDMPLRSPVIVGELTIGPDECYIRSNGEIYDAASTEDMEKLSRIVEGVDNYRLATKTINPNITSAYFLTCMETEPEKKALCNEMGILEVPPKEYMLRTVESCRANRPSRISSETIQDW